MADAAPAGRFAQRVPDKRVTLVGAGITIVAGVVPWATRQTPAGRELVLGVDVNGFLTLLLGVAVVGVVLARDWTLRDRVGIALLAATSLALVWQFLADVNTIQQFGRQSSTAVSVTPHLGPYLTAGGALLILAGSLGSFLVDRVT